MDSDSIIPDKNSSRLRSKRGSETLLWGQTDGCRGRQGHQYRGWSCSPENRSSYSVPMKPKASDISSGNCCWQYGLSVILRMNAAIQTDHPIFCKHLPLAVVCAASCQLPRRTVASSRPKEAVSTDHQHPTPYNTPMVCANTQLKPCRLDRTTPSRAVSRTCGSGLAEGHLHVPRPPRGWLQTGILSMQPAGRSLVLVR